MAQIIIGTLVFRHTNIGANMKQLNVSFFSLVLFIPSTKFVRNKKRNMKEKIFIHDFDLMCAQFVRPYDFHPMKKNPSQSLIHQISKRMLNESETENRYV